jgi:hypothetical protein
MHLDKGSKELVVKYVYAGDGGGSLEQVTQLAAQTQPGAATPVVRRLNESVRTFTLRMPALQVRGFALRIEVVGISLDGIRAAIPKAEAVEMETTILQADAMIFVVGRGDSDAKSTFDRACAQLPCFGPGNTKSPIAIVTTDDVDARAVLGVGDVPIVSGPHAAIGALKALVKPMLLGLVKSLGD